MAEISWQKFCGPKRNGGLGFRNLHESNKAFIMKLAWGLINTPQAFWVRILKDKYGCGEKRNASTTWRSV